MFKSVPKRPNLEFDRKQAKTLLEQLLAGDQQARRRFEDLHPAGIPARPKLADAQSVVAREYGFTSWPAWKSFVATRGLDRQRRIDVILRAICSNDISRARTLLDVEPELAAQDFYLACACGESEVVDFHLRRDPTIARNAGGVNGWSPLEYACFSRWLRCDPLRSKGILRVVELLIGAGADPNASHTVQWMGDPWTETVLFAASGIANHPDLTRSLLSAGADVNEGLPEPDPQNSKASSWAPEALYHTCEFRETECLRLLLEARPHLIFVSCCLARALDFENPHAVELFLEYGADPNFRLPWQSDRTHLHRAIQSGRSAGIVRALLQAGADPEARDGRDWTARQLAASLGRDDLDELFGMPGELNADQATLRRVISGTHAGGRISSIRPSLLCEAAKRNDASMIDRLVDAGADVNAPDESPYGSPPLHWAAWRGRLKAVRRLVERGADIHGRNPYGGDALATAIHGSANCFDVEGGPAMRLPEEALKGDYSEIVEYLIERGARLPEAISEGGENVREVLRRHGIPDEVPGGTSEPTL